MEAGRTGEGGRPVPIGSAFPSKLGDQRITAARESFVALGLVIDEAPVCRRCVAPDSALGLVAVLAIALRGCGGVTRTKKLRERHAQ